MLHHIFYEALFVCYNEQLSWDEVCRIREELREAMAAIARGHQGLKLQDDTFDTPEGGLL